MQEDSPTSGDVHYDQWQMICNDNRMMSLEWYIKCDIMQLYFCTFQKRFNLFWYWKSNVSCWNTVSFQAKELYLEQERGD